MLFIDGFEYDSPEQKERWAKEWANWKKNPEGTQITLKKPGACTVGWEGNKLVVDTIVDGEKKTFTSTKNCLRKGVTIDWDENGPIVKHNGVDVENEFRG